MFKKDSGQGQTPRALTVGGRAFVCHVCQGNSFHRRSVQLNTAGMTLFGVDWLNKAADGAVCTGCGYVHLFLGVMHTWTG